MKAQRKSLWRALFVALMVSAISPFPSHAQCYPSQGCYPVDYLNYIPNGTGQVFHGDGASNNPAGGWKTDYADVNQCLGCHYGTDTMPYLMTGHKNTMRKEAANVLWGGPDNASYSTNDDHYSSGSTFDWTQALVTVGWCNPVSTSLQNGLAPTDPACKYPYYTKPNVNAPASYTPAPTQAAGGVRTLYYLFGGWLNYGGAANPAATQLGTIFDKGFTGDLYPNGNFDCARCHATGYNFDHWGPEPTSNTSGQVTWIPDANFSRLPTDGYLAAGTNGTSSWYLTGVQCERCHAAAWSYGSHPNGGLQATIAHNEAATALCLECHREESVAPANPALSQPGSIVPTNPLQTLDRGYCSDFSGSAYAACAANPEARWIYQPNFGYGKGQEFLNSPHARFTGNLVQNAQHSPDLSITIAGTYASEFSESRGDPTKNSGCTGCHDPHQSISAAVNPALATKPIVNTCDTCHPLAKTILQTTIHPAGPGTPFPTGTQSDLPGACIVCHMQAGLGRANSHLFRINSDMNYRTFPTPDQLYSQGSTGAGTAPEYSPMDGTAFSSAIWIDVDLACGQCHVGGDGITNPYNLTMPPGMPGAHAYTKAQLAYWASIMHAPDPGVPTPAFSPAPGTYTMPQSVTISDSLNGATIFYTMDGSLPNTSSPVYSTPIPIAATTSFRAMATYPGMPRSSVALAVYSILLPTAPPPLFAPPPSTFSAAQSVSLSNTANLPMFYTTDSSTPTTGSTPYTAAIPVTKNTVIRAITGGPGYLTSAVSIGNYFIQAPVPVFAPGSGTYYAAQNVTISDAVIGATIYYTTNGSTPTTASTPCANPCLLAIATTGTIKAIAAGGGYASSNVALATYTFAAANPVFSPSASTFYAPVTVTLTDTTPGVLIYYALNGFPTTSSPSCASPCAVNISATTTLRAMAAGSGISQSGTTAAMYTIAANTPVISPGSGSYATSQTVTITETTPGVTIYYALNGFPTTSSPSCASPCVVTISASTILRSMATGNGISQSGTAVASYTITGH